MADNDDFLDNIEGSEDTEESNDQEIGIESREVSSKLEKKRLK